MTSTPILDILTARSNPASGAYRSLLRELDPTCPQYLAMLGVWEQDGRTVAELGEAMSLDSGTLSPLLQRLEKAGLIRRERSEHGERVVRIYVTPEGAGMEARMNPVRLAVESATDLVEVEFVELRERLHRLNAMISGHPISA